MIHHQPSMAHYIQPALGVYMSSLIVKGSTKSWEAHVCDQQFGENENTAIEKGQRLRTEAKTRINQVSPMGPGLARMIEKVCISRCFERPEAALHIAENACCIAYADTWLSKRVHSQSKSQSTHCGTTNHGSVIMVEFKTGVSFGSLPNATIHSRVAQQSTIHSLPATLPNTGRMDHHQVHHGWF